MPLPILYQHLILGLPGIEFPILSEFIIDACKHGVIHVCCALFDATFKAYSVGYSSVNIWFSCYNIVT